MLLAVAAEGTTDCAIAPPATADLKSYAASVFSETCPANLEAARWRAGLLKALS